MSFHARHTLTQSAVTEEICVIKKWQNHKHVGNGEHLNKRQKVTRSDTDLRYDDIDRTKNLGEHSVDAVTVQSAPTSEVLWLLIYINF